MLRKLFSRSKSSVKAAKPEVKKPAEAPATRSLEQWSSELAGSAGKAKNQLFTELCKQIDANAFQTADVYRVLQGVDQLTLALHYDLEVSNASDADLVEVALHGFTAGVRKAAAERINNEQDIQALAKATKGKDKAVYRILHDKAEAIHQQQKRTLELEQKQLAIVEGIEKLAEGSLEPMYSAKLKGLQEQWREVGIEQGELAQRFQLALERAKKKVDEHEAAEQAQQVQQQAEAMVDSNRQQMINELLAALLARLDSFDFSEEELSKDQHLLSGIQHQWREAEQLRKADKDESRAFQRACTAFEVGLGKVRLLHEHHGTLEQMVERLNGQGDVESLLHEVDDCLHDLEVALSIRIPESVVQLQGAMAKYQKNLAQHRQQEIDRVRAIRSQIRRCQSAVEEGHLRRASGLYHGIEEKLEGFDLTHHAGIRKQLDEATEALEKLRDWQAYAVLPKKEALIKRMQALVSQSVDPDTRAQAIRDMQDEWKQLSRGLQDRQQDLWEAFHELAQQAYEPCKEFFSEQRNLREVNLDRRKEVVQQLQQYSQLIDWQQPDIKEIDRVLQVARNDWRKYSPVDRSANKPVQDAFDRLHKQLFDQLRKEQDVYKAAKQAIIEKARALLELEDIKEATEQAKKLQRDWKHAGIVARKDEQALWKEFRVVCDELFERREKQLNEFKADLEANKHQAETIITSLQELVSGDAIDQVLAQQSVFENLKSQYEALGTLPKAQYQKITKQYKDVCEAFDRACRQARLAEADQHWQQLFAWVRDARFAALAETELLDRWQNMKVPEPARSLKDHISAWQGSIDDLNLAALHEKTVDLEIMLDVDSPQEDAQMRMNLQVQRLSDGIGATLSKSDLDGLVVSWLATGAVEKADYDRFEARMLAARKQGI